ERYRIRSVPPAVGSLLGDDDAGSDVALAGNSFTMPRMGFTPALSSALGRPVSLFMRAGNFGHWKMLTEYLSGPIFRNTRPRLLIWQLLEGNMEHMPDQRGYFGANAMAPAEFLRVVRQAAAR
ncbi:MAG: twin-arginine translocation pathway signal, partial [Alphaproteobacteria bacterium]|nr:twin-arginine translocation pathway signal [Alphaproteobacteria bacterium]